MLHASRWYGGRRYRCVPIFLRYEHVTAGADIVRRARYGFAIFVGTEMIFDHTNPEQFYLCREARDGADVLAGDIEKLGLRAGIEAFMSRDIGRKRNP
jgi:hypothetical protein